MDISGELALMPPDESESDILPFAIDTEWSAGAQGSTTAAAVHHGTSDQQLRFSGSGGTGVEGVRNPFAQGGGVGGGVRGVNQQVRGAGGDARDVAVGAFIKLIQEAPPLQRVCVDVGGGGVGGWDGGVGGMGHQQQQQVLTGDRLTGLTRERLTGLTGLTGEPLTVAEGLMQVDQLASKLQQLLAL